MRSRPSGDTSVWGLSGLLVVAIVSASMTQPHARTRDATQPPDPSPQEQAAAQVPLPSPPYQDLRRIRPIAGSASAGAAKAEVCAPCHGALGTATAPIFPNLAGQRADYLYWELKGFMRGTRPDSPMSALASVLDDQGMRDVAAYFAAQSIGAVPPPTPPEPSAEPVTAPEPAPEPDPVLLRTGQTLYESGDLSKGVPACRACHGADAKGHPEALRADSNGHTPFAVYPVLRGQQAAYLETRLGQYRAGTLKDSTTDFVMTGIGERLDDDSIKALAAWLASLKP